MVLVDRVFWSPLLDWVREHALTLGMVAPEDLELLTVTDDPEEAVRVVLGSYRTLFPTAPVRTARDDVALRSWNCATSHRWTSSRAGWTTRSRSLPRGPCSTVRARRSVRADPGDLSERLAVECVAVRAPSLRRVLTRRA